MLKKIIFYFVFTTVILANGKPSIIDNQIMELGLNYQFEEALNMLNKQYNKSDELKHHYLYLNIQLIKNIDMLNKVEFNRRTALKDSLNQELLDYTEKIIEKYENYKSKNLSIHNRFYLGTIHGLMGRLYGVNQSWMSAFSSGKKGKNILEDVVEENPNYIDAYLLLGMMNYYVDRMGSITKFIASVLGLSGDRETGINNLRTVMDKGNLSKWQAAMILAELYARLENNKFEALPILEKMYNKFPQNNHFTNWYLYELLYLNKIKEAEAILNSDINIKFYPFIKATYHHLIVDYKKSNEIYDTLLTDKNKIFPWVYNRNRLNHAINYLMLGDVKTAEKISQDLSERYKAHFNAIIKDKSLSKKLYEFRKKILLEEDDVIEMLNNPPKFNGSKYLEAFYHYYTGIYYFKKNNLRFAEKSFTKAKKLDWDNFHYYSIKYLIEIYKSINADRNAVAKLIDEIEDMPESEFEFSKRDLEKKYRL